MRADLGKWLVVGEPTVNLHHLRGPYDPSPEPTPVVIPHAEAVIFPENASVNVVPSSL